VAGSGIVEGIFGGNWPGRKFLSLSSRWLADVLGSCVLWEETQDESEAGSRENGAVQRDGYGKYMIALRFHKILQD